MASKILDAFVRDALEKGQARAAIADALLKAGWRQGEIDTALSAYSDVPFVVAVPRPRPYLSAREAFLYLLFFILLGIVSFNLGSLLWALIDRAIVDPAGAAGGTYYFNEGQIRSAMAGLIVGLPLFLWLGRTLRKTRAVHVDLERSPIRKWLTYISLVFAGCTLIGDAIFLVSGFLSGDLTTRFLLKAMVVALIAGGIFVYFVGDAEKGDSDVAA
jgi:hypothetical protein